MEKYISKKARNKAEYLKITQVQEDGNYTEVVTLQCLTGTFYKTLPRIFPDALKGEPMSGDVLVTLMFDHVTPACDDSLMITSHNGIWLLRDFFRLSEDIWKKLTI